MEEQDESSIPEYEVGVNTNRAIRHSWMLAYFSEDTQSEVWEKNLDAKVASSFAPFPNSKNMENRCAKGNGSILFSLKNVYVSKHRTVDLAARVAEVSALLAAVEAVLSEKKAITLKSDIWGRKGSSPPHFFKRGVFNFNRGMLKGICCEYGVLVVYLIVS